MIKMIADKTFEYAGCKLEPKDKFDCEERNVEGLIAIGYAHLPRGSGYRTRALQAERTGVAA